jgi:hypothetical protein
MADAPSVITPDYTDIINQSFFIEPLGGPLNPVNYLDRFPDEVYNKTLDSHLVKFIYSLVGPAGVGWLRKTYLEARIQLEEYGVEVFDLDSFYGDPLKFGRILEEMYDEDPRGLLSRSDWDAIRAKDAAYRARALDYVRGMRLGNTPAGMKLVARSGLGHEVEIVEHYKWLYDQYSDDYLGLPRFGVTNSTEEMVILPRRELAQSEIQQVTINGAVTGGFFKLGFNGHETADIAYTSGAREVIRTFLETIPDIGLGNVEVMGGPLPGTPIQIYFKNDLANRDVPQIYSINSLAGDGIGIVIETVRGGIEGTDEIGSISPRDQHHLMEALDHLRPQTTLVTYQQASGAQTRTIWNQVDSTSSYTEVIRFVTGAVNVPWPSITSSNRYWIEAGVEHEGKRVRSDLQHHYIGFHQVARALAYTESALNNPDYADLNVLLATLVQNEHIGQYTTYQRNLYSALGSYDAQFKNTADMAPADYSEPLTVTTQQDESVGAGPIINGIYPIEYQDLPNVQPVKYRHEQFWGSIEREAGDDYLEIDFGSVKPVNYLSFEATRKPYSIEVEFDVLDQGVTRRFVSTAPHPTLPSNYNLGYSPSFTNPWEAVVINFTDVRGYMVFTRYLRLRFSRRPDSNSPFIGPDGSVKPSSIEVRNLRVGRSAT